MTNIDFFERLESLGSDQLKQDQAIKELGTEIRNLITNAWIGDVDLSSIWQCAANVYWCFRAHRRNMIAHFENAKSDKYYHSALSCEYLFTCEFSEVFTLGNAYKYLSRYITEGFAKSGNAQDIYKALHYIYLTVNKHA
jgi:hypothetical protein